MIILLLLVGLSYPWNLEHSTSCSHYLFNSTTLSFVCHQTLFQYNLNQISQTPDSATSPPVSQTYNLSSTLQTLLHISDTHILGSEKACTSFRLTYTSCDPLTLTTIAGLSSQISTPQSVWLDEIQFDFPFLFLFDISTYELEVKDLTHQTSPVTRASAMFEGSKFRLQVSRINTDINLVLLYHPFQANQVYEFDRTSHSLTPVSSFQNPLTGYVADAQMYSRFIVYVHFSLIMVYRHNESGETSFSCELEDKVTDNRFSSDFKKRVYFTEQNDLVFGTFTNEDFVYVVTISKPTGSCYVKGYQFKDKSLSFGFFSQEYIYAVFEFNGEVARSRESQYSYFLGRKHEWNFEAWMIVLIVMPLVVILVIVILLCVYLKNKKKRREARLGVFTQPPKQKKNKNKHEKPIKLEIEDEVE